MNGHGRRLSSRWAKRDYQVVDGYIRPDPKSRLEVYDPFNFYFGPESVKQGRSLYLELANLDTGSDRAIEQFACHWGLLGLFSHRLIEIRYWRPGMKEGLPSISGQGGFYQLGARSPDLIIECLPPEWIQMMEEGGWHGSATVLEPLPGWCVERPLQTYCAPYFPDGGSQTRPSSHDQDGYEISDRRLFALLDSMSRWDFLAEPVQEFQEAADEFRSTFRDWQRLSRSTENDGEAGLLKQRLDDHVRHVHPTLVIERDDREGPGHLHGRGGRQAGGAKPWSSGWSFPSLLSAAYMMLLQDLAGNRNIRFCANERCGGPFVTDRADKLYCSPACKNAQQQRTHRRASLRN
jgi:hypothetical protein